MPKLKHQPNKNHLPAVPTSGLYVSAFGYGDDKRLARLLRETWQRIPLGDRRRMIKHWEKRRFLVRNENGEAFTIWSPCVELMHGVKNGRAESDEPIYPTASTSDRGHEIQFAAPYFAVASDRAVIGLIAHELAHVYQHAIGAEWPAPGESHWWIEMEADEIARCNWDFGDELEANDAGTEGWIPPTE